MKPQPIDIAVSARIEVHPALDRLLEAVRACRACDAHLPHGPRPVLQAGATARILIVGQAPGAKVHASGVPWDDRSGERLRDWMGIGAKTFYDSACVAIGKCWFMGDLSLVELGHDIARWPS